MNEAIKAGEVFKLAELVPYVEGKIVNMDVVHNDQMKFVVMAFDEGTGLSEHAAPGEALIFALDGEGLQKALCPADTLVPGLTESRRLLVIKDRIMTIADPVALRNAIHREFQVLCQGIIGPPVIFIDNITVYKEPGAGDGTAAM